MHYPVGITCQELVELVTDYLDGALSTGQRARFEAHLSTCPGCEDYLQQMRLTISATGRLTEDSLEPNTRVALLALFRDWKRGG